jgi:hypothetical protein
LRFVGECDGYPSVRCPQVDVGVRAAAHGLFRAQRDAGDERRPCLHGRASLRVCVCLCVPPCAAHVMIGEVRRGCLPCPARQAALLFLPLPPSLALHRYANMAMPMAW